MSLNASHNFNDLSSRLASIYDPEKLEATFDATVTSSTTSKGAPANEKEAWSCVLCSKVGTHRCSRCRHRHYCSKYKLKLLNHRKL